MAAQVTDRTWLCKCAAIGYERGIWRHVVARIRRASLLIVLAHPDDEIVQGGRARAPQ